MRAARLYVLLIAAAAVLGAAHVPFAAADGAPGSLQHAGSSGREHPHLDCSTAAAAAAVGMRRLLGPRLPAARRELLVQHAVPERHDVGMGRRAVRTRCARGAPTLLHAVRSRGTQIGQVAVPPAPRRGAFAARQRRQHHLLPRQRDHHVLGGHAVGVSGGVTRGTRAVSHPPRTRPWQGAFQDACDPRRATDPQHYFVASATLSNSSAGGLKLYGLVREQQRACWGGLRNHTWCKRRTATPSGTGPFGRALPECALPAPRRSWRRTLPWREAAARCQSSTPRRRRAWAPGTISFRCAVQAGGWVGGRGTPRGAQRQPRGTACSVSAGQGGRQQEGVAEGWCAACRARASSASFGTRRRRTHFAQQQWKPRTGRALPRSPPRWWRCVRRSARTRACTPCCRWRGAPSPPSRSKVRALRSGPAQTHSCCGSIRRPRFSP